MTSRDQQRFEVNGRVVDKNGAGVANLKIRAFDHDPGKAPQRLGEIDTGADGRFLISFPASAAGGASEGAPEFFVLVHNRAGMLVHSGVPITLAAARHDLADIVAHARKPPPSPADNGGVVTAGGRYRCSPAIQETPGTSGPSGGPRGGALIGKLGPLPAPPQTKEKPLPKCISDFLKPIIPNDASGITLHRGSLHLNGGSIVDGQTIYLATSVYDNPFSDLTHLFHEIGHTLQYDQGTLSLWSAIAGYIFSGNHDDASFEQEAVAFSANMLKHFNDSGAAAKCGL